MSRRAADTVIEGGRVQINGQVAQLGQPVQEDDSIIVDGMSLKPTVSSVVLLNKPLGYVCSRARQGNKTIYDLLPPALHDLKPIGRLDKDSSGLLLLTNDGNLANKLTHPKHQKDKVYEVVLNRSLTKEDKTKIKKGIMLLDGLSRLDVNYRPEKDPQPLSQPQSIEYKVTMHEGRNRQIRRTFAALGYKVIKLHRRTLGPYQLKDLAPGAYKILPLP